MNYCASLSHTLFTKMVPSAWCQNGLCFYLPVKDKHPFRYVSVFHLMGSNGFLIFLVFLLYIYVFFLCVCVPKHVIYEKHSFDQFLSSLDILHFFMPISWLGSLVQ